MRHVPVFLVLVGVGGSYDTHVIIQYYYDLKCNQLVRMYRMHTVPAAGIFLSENNNIIITNESVQNVNSEKKNSNRVI